MSGQWPGAGSLNDTEWLKAKIQQEGLSAFERNFIESYQWSQDSGYKTVMSLEEFRRQYPLKAPRLEE